MSNAFKRSLNKLTSVVGIQHHSTCVLDEGNNFLSAEVCAVLNSMPDNTSLHTANGDAVWVSKNAKKTFTATSPNLLGKAFFDAANPQDKLKIFKAFSDCANLGETQSIVFRAQQQVNTGNVEAYTYELRISAYQYDNQELYLALIRDITTEQCELDRAHKEIKQANASNSTKSLFLSNMSHELRTPLNAIIGFSQMLMGEAALVISEDKKTEYAEHINQSANHLLNIINDVLDLSKIEAGKFQIIPEVLNVSQELESTLKLMDPLASKAKLSIKTEIADELPNITADPRALRQIIMNLVANAIKFSTEHSQVKVTLKRDRRKIRLEVADNGLGMKPEAVEQLGKSFFQVEQTASRRFEGTGLGLSIVFGLIKLHDGTISFRSKLEQGTTVSVELPISNQKSIPVPSDPDEAIVFLNEAREPNLLRKLDKIPTVRKAG